MARTRYSKSALWDPTGTRRLTRAYEHDLVGLITLYQKAMIQAIVVLAVRIPPHLMETPTPDSDPPRSLETRLDPHDLTETIEEINQEIKKRGSTAVDEHIPKAYEAGKRFAAMELGKVGIDVSVSEGHQNLNAADWRTIDWLRARNTSYIKGMTDEMGKRLITTLEEGIRSGEGIPKLERRVRDVMDSGKSSAERIARTEHMYAVNQGSLIRYSQYGVTQVKWLAGGDPPRCCDICMDRDGHVYDIHEVPPIPAHPNCRCTITPVIEIPGKTTNPEETATTREGIERGQDLLPKVQKIVSKYEAKYRELSDQIHRYHNEAGKLGEEWQRIFNSARTDKERMDALALWTREYMPKIAAIEAKKAPLVDALNNIKTAGRYDIHEILKLKTPTKVTYDLSKASKLYKENKGSVDKAFKFFGEMVVSDKYSTANPVKINTLRAGARASTSLDGRSINIATSDAASTIVHELGHTLEIRDPVRLQEALRFYKYRTAEEPLIGLKRATGLRGYRSNEVTRKDKFLSAYMGKDYNGRATELTSMGLQYLYTQPGALASKDPEYFVFLINIARGTF